MTLRIHEDALAMVKAAYKAAEQIEKHDADLARQLRRSSSSVPLNISEGSHSRKGNRAVRYSSAMGSANEVRSTLQVAAAVGLIAENAELEDRLDKIVATLWTLTR
jgi:four helix bundle protein